MRIAQVNNNIRPVDRLATGSIAAHVGALSDTLVEHGNEVDLYATVGSRSNANIIPFDQPDGALSPDQLTLRVDTVVLAAAQNAVKGTYDVVHNHVWPTPKRLEMLQTISRFTVACSVLHTMPEDIGISKESVESFDRLPFIAFTNAQAAELDVNWVGVVKHGVDTDALQPHPDDIVASRALVIGKIYPAKRTHEAILAAQKSGLDVQVAGPILDEQYFRKFVQPLIGQKGVTYSGVISGEEKRQAYAQSAVTVTASRVRETFCLVLAESMACGTPAVAVDSLACGEVIDDDITGYVVSDSAGLVTAIHQALTLNRSSVRSKAVERYNLDTMAAGYERVYQSLL